MLLIADANPDAKHALLGPALQLASFLGFTSIVELLIASGADVNLQSIRFGTALQAAAAAGHSEIVAILLAKGSKPDVVGGLLGNAIQAAVTGGHSTIVQMLAAKDIAWDEKRDSTWHEALDLWVSRSPRAIGDLAQSLLSTELPVGSNAQRMLASVLETFSSLYTTSNAKAAKTRMGAAPGLDSRLTRSQTLLEQVRRQGQEGMESEHYVYRALFWATLLRCTTMSRPENMAMLYKFGVTITLRSLDQKAIEHSTSDDFIAVRHELVECYALAFQVVMESGLLNSRMRLKMLLSPHRYNIGRMIEGVERQNERVENLMKIIRLHEPSTEALLLGQMHRELLAKMEQEMRGCFQTLEESMQKNLAEVEKRVVASVQDILPGIIRDEMRKLLAEQKGSAGLNNHS